MPERIANKIVLAEDVEQQNLVRRYLERCGHDPRDCRFERAARGRGGSGEKYVRDQYPRQVQACRSALGRVSALLVVVVDADMETTRYRAKQLSDALEAANVPPRGNQEPIVVLIPKRHVETWIQALVGNQVDEETDYTKAPYSPPSTQDIKQAATELHTWTHPDPRPGATSPPSLTDSLPEWRKIPG